MEYKRLKLRDVCTVNQGLQIPISKRFKEKGKNRYFYITIQFLKGNTEEYYIENPNQSVICNKEDILVVRTGSTGLVITGVEGCFHNNFFKVKPKENIFSKYLYYCLNNKYMYKKMLNAASGTTIPDLKHSAFYDLEIKMPEYEEQKKVAIILSNLDKKIKLNTQINNNLYDIASKLYEEKFVNCRNEEWDEYRLIDIANIVNGYSYKGTELVNESSIGMATIKNFDRNGGFKEDGFKPLNPNKIKDSQYIEKFDVIVACTDLTQNADIIGNTVLLLSKEKYEKIIISMDLVKIVPISDLVDNFMIYSILNSKEFKNFALGYTSGTTVLHLNKNCFKDYIIKLPQKNEIDNFIKTLKPIYMKISEIMEENKVLEKLRDTLLPKLMNGEIDLENIEI